MLRYGQELAFLDATCKTTHYALPLFFLCVHTNSGYIVVAVIVIEREDPGSLSQALCLLRQSATQWNPSAFMLDSSKVEITAVKAAFPGMNVITADVDFCTFSRRVSPTIKHNVQHSSAFRTTRQGCHCFLDTSMTF